MTTSDSVENGPTFGIHGMVWVGDWSPESAGRAIAGAAAAGYDLIEIPIQEPETVDVSHTRDLLAKHRIRGTVAHALPPTADVSSADPAVVARGAERLRSVLATTVALGGTQIAGVLASALTKYSQPATKQGYANSVAVIRELAREAQRSGVTLAIEAVNRYETNLTNTAADTLRFIDAVSEPNVTVHLDTFHMHIEEADCAAAIALCADRLGHFHVNESHRGYLGTGTMVLPPMFRALARMRYNRSITFEAFSSSVAGEELAGMVGAWRDIWSDSDDIAAHALAYMRREYLDAKRTLPLIGPDR